MESGKVGETTLWEKEGSDWGREAGARSISLGGMISTGRKMEVTNGHFTDLESSNFNHRKTAARRLPDELCLILILSSHWLKLICWS